MVPSLEVGEWGGYLEELLISVTPEVKLMKLKTLYYVHVRSSLLHYNTVLYGTLQKSHSISAPKSTFK